MKVAAMHAYNQALNGERRREVLVGWTGWGAACEGSTMARSRSLSCPRPPPAACLPNASRCRQWPAHHAGTAFRDGVVVAGGRGGTTPKSSESLQQRAAAGGPDQGMTHADRGRELQPGRPALALACDSWPAATASPLCTLPHRWLPQPFHQPHTQKLLPRLPFAAGQTQQEQRGGSLAQLVEDGIIAGRGAAGVFEIDSEKHVRPAVGAAWEEGGLIAERCLLCGMFWLRPTQLEPHIAEAPLPPPLPSPRSIPSCGSSTGSSSPLARTRSPSPAPPRCSMSSLAPRAS